jgi:ATP-dependent Lon protease
MLPILPLRDIVVFPHRIVPCSSDAKSPSLRSRRRWPTTANCSSSPSSIRARTIPIAMRSMTSGVIATAMQLLKLPDGTVRVLVEGVKRARLVDLWPRDGFVARG